MPEYYPVPIQELLANAVQPLDDLPPDEFDGLRKLIGKRPLLTPVLLTEDGLLFDGNQRCRALLTNGRKKLFIEEIRIVEKVTRKNAVRMATRSNLARRHLTMRDKGKLARRYRDELRWSQRQIAEEFNVSQPAVAKWLKLADEGDNRPPQDYVVGGDGKVYPVRRKPAASADAKPTLPMWGQRGRGHKLLVTATQLLDMDLDLEGLDGPERLVLANEVESLRLAVTHFQARLSQAGP